MLSEVVSDKCQYIMQNRNICNKDIHESSYNKCILHCTKENWYRYVRDVNNNIIGRSWRKGFKKGWIKEFWNEVEHILINEGKTVFGGFTFPVGEDYKLDIEKNIKKSEIENKNLLNDILSKRISVEDKKIIFKNCEFLFS